MLGVVGRCSTWSTSREVREYYGRRLLLRGKRSTWSTSVSFCVAGAVLGATRERSAEVRQVQHLEHFRLILRGRRSASTSVSFCVAGAALGAPPETSAEVRRQVSTMDAGCFCVAGAALGAPQSHFALQAQQHLVSFLRGKCSTFSTSKEVHGSPAAFAWQVQHLEHLRPVLCSTSVSFRVAGAAFGAPPERSGEAW